MLDRYDPRDDVERERGSGADRSRGSRGGGDRDDAFDAEPRVFSRDLDLPDGDARELVRHRGRDYELSGAEAEALATVGAFRVVQAHDLRDVLDDGVRGASAPKSVEHLAASGLVDRIRLDGRERDVVVLTPRGRDLLDAHRHDREAQPRQTFYAGLKKPRELTHDAHVYRAFQRAETRLRGQGARVRRVVLDYELKRDYQQFLQERNRGRGDSDGRPDRTAEEVAVWAQQHDLPYFDEAVHFPDARLEVEDADGRLRHEDLEVVTPHYRGAHGASAARSGFSRYGAGLGSGSTGGRGGRARRAGLAEELLP